MAGFVIRSRAGPADGVMDDVAPGRRAETQVVPHPRIGRQGSDAATCERLHEDARAASSIANSVTARVNLA